MSLTGTSKAAGDGGHRGAGRPPVLRTFGLLPAELVVDNFAGGGGASAGIEEAIGRPIDIAINHDPEAIAMHRVNHPETRHYCEDVWAVDPMAACAGRAVGLAWFSPDCSHFSRAKGTTPRKQGIRGLAWVVIRWARAVRPRMIILENVEEFQTWGPLAADGRPDAGAAGATFRAWLAELVGAGYSVEFRSLVAADYGAPTTRRRLYLIARADGGAIVWPEQTHGRGRALAWRAAAEIIDWSLPCPSIFDRTRSLAPATLRRIAEGLRRFVLGSRQPFLLPSPQHTHAHGFVEHPAANDRVMGCRSTAAASKHGLVAAFMSKHFGGPNGHPAIGHGLQMTLGTVTARDHHALTTALLKKCQEDGPAVHLRTTAGTPRFGEVQAFLIKYYGAQQGQEQQISLPLHTVTSKARFGLVTIAGEAYEIADIGMRMLAPAELYAAQGFPAHYDIAPFYNGKPLTKTAQIRMAGNSVCPPVAEALVTANLGAEQGRRAA